MSTSESLAPTYLGNRVRIAVGDITAQDVDAIVNAANSTLLGGGGVDGAIHRAGGPAILEECREIRRTKYPKGLPTGEAVLTTAGKLKARYVIHTVGPIFGQEKGREAELLAACYRNSLKLANDSSLSTIAFPAISTGVYGYPLSEAAVVSSQAIKEFVATDNLVKEIRLIFFKQSDMDAFVKNQRFE